MCFKVHVDSSFYHITVNGQLEEEKTKADTGVRTKSAKTPEGKPGKKRDRQTPRREIKVSVVGVSGCY